MKNRLFVCMMVLTAFVFAGCAGPHARIAPQNAKKIYIKPFVNSTSQYGLEDKLTLAVTNELINDGHKVKIGGQPKKTRFSYSSLPQ